MQVFLSHATVDHDARLRLKDTLQNRVDVWVDQEEIIAGGSLTPEIEAAIRASQALVVLLSEQSVESDWVYKEVKYARDVGIRIIPVTLDLDMKALPERLRSLVGDQSAVNFAPLAVARHRILSALGLDPLGEVRELVLSFSDAELVEAGKPKVACVEAMVRWGERGGRFRAPIGPLEADSLRWYLEKYHIWPADEFATRAKDIEGDLPKWGRALWDALLAALGEGAAAEFAAWLAATDAPYRRALALQVEPPDPDHATPQQFQGIASLLALPWELLRDRDGWLFHAHRVSLRRLLPSGQPVPPARAPIKVLVVVARPEGAGLIDPRGSGLALLDAVHDLGSAVHVDFLRPPTVPALVTALKRGGYHVLHFDGHGVYDPHTGLGYLCFEHTEEGERRRGTSHFISGADLREMLGKVPLPLAYLEACQTAQEGDDAGTAVASALLDAGAGGVIAMSHSVLVTASRRFTGALYRALCEGLTVGGAVSEARAELYLKRDRAPGLTGPGFSLHDWFVPVLLQRGLDHPLLPGGALHHRPDPILQEKQAFAVQTLPTLQHGFVGRWREHLVIERAFEDGGARIALITGIGGQGKTTLAAEMGRWLYRTGRFPGGVAFVSVEGVVDLTGVLSGLCRAVLPGFALQSVEQGREALLKHLRARPTLVILDNFESVLAPPEAAPRAKTWQHEPEFLGDLLTLAHDLARAGDSRVIITSREGIDDDRFRSGRTTRVLVLEGLSRSEAIELVGEICRHVGVRTEASEETQGALVDAVGCHPRSLVLLPPLLKEQGVAEVTGKLHALMVEQERKFPGQRERSLYASVKLSLDRLPAGVRGKLGPLGLLRKGASVLLLSCYLNMDQEEAKGLCEALAEGGLATLEDGVFLHFHPALTPFLEAEFRERQPSSVAALEQRLVDVSEALVADLYTDQLRGPNALAIKLLLAMDVPNFMIALDHLVERASDAHTTDRALTYATRLEGNLGGKPNILKRVTAIRESLSGQRARLGGWSKAFFDAERNRVELLFDAGRMAEALDAGRSLLTTSASQAFADAELCLAEAHWLLGRISTVLGDIPAALEHTTTARGIFVRLDSSNHVNHMACTCLIAMGDCLLKLGRTRESAKEYERARQEAEAMGDGGSVAVATGQLATIAMLGGKHADAVRGWRALADLCANDGNSALKGNALHQLGMAYIHASDLERAAQALRDALALRQTAGQQTAAAETMLLLAMVADLEGRVKEGLAWNRRALEGFLSVGHPHHEAASRRSLAQRLFQLGQLAEAEAQVRQAITVQEHLGIGTEPWSSWAILSDIARSRGDADGASLARGKALDWYRRYRNQGGRSLGLNPLLSEAATALSTPHNRAAVLTRLEVMASVVGTRSWRPLLFALIALLRGNPATARAALPAIDPMNAVELEFLLAGTWP